MNKLTAIVIIILVVALASSINFNFVQFIQNQELASNDDAAVYYSEFGAIPATNVNSSFTPPVSIYRALQIALETDGWNRTALRGMVVGAYLMYGETFTNQSAPGIGINGEVTNPPKDYSDVYDNGVIHLYVWEVTVNNASRNVHPPLGFSLVDASTGYILPNPPLF